MAKILWNKKGHPLLAYGKTYFATTTGEKIPKTKNVTNGSKTSHGK